MDVYVVEERPLAEERELHIGLSKDKNDKLVWEVTCSIPKYINALKKSGWIQISESRLKSDGTVQEARFRCYDAKPITFRNLNRQKRVLSEEHIEKLRTSLQKSRENKA